MSAQTPGCGSNSEARKRAADRPATDTAASEGEVVEGWTTGVRADVCTGFPSSLPTHCSYCGPGYRYGDDGCQHAPPAAPVAVEGVETVEALTPDQRRRFTEAAERGLAPRRAILLLASHATNHRKHPHGDTCESCGSHWPCQIVRRAASPALRAVENLTPLSPVEPETSEPEGGESRG